MCWVGNACPGTLNPLAVFAFVVAVASQPIREGRCGEGTDPLRWVAKDCIAGRRQRENLLPTKTVFHKRGRLDAYAQCDAPHGALP